MMTTFGMVGALLAGSLQAQERQMQDLLRPWLDVTCQKTEGTDSNVREFVAKTIPEIQAAVPRQLAAPVRTRHRILVITTSTMGALHAPGAAGLLVLLREAGKLHGMLEFSEVYTDRALDRASLGKYDVVVLNNISQQFGNADFYNKVLPEYVRRGGGLLAVHGAALLFRAQPEAEYNTMLGGFTTANPVHPSNHDVVFPVKQLDPDHPLSAGFRGTTQTCSTKGQVLLGQTRKLFDLNFKAPDTLADELYTFHPQANRDGSSRVIIAVDREKMAGMPVHPEYPAGTPEFGYALAWIKRYGQGRMFYTQLGHNFSVFSVLCVAHMLIDGLQYAAGDLRVPEAPVADNTR